MNNEEKIVSLLETLVGKVDALEQGQQTLVTKVDALEQGQQQLEQGQQKLQQGQLRLELMIETEIRRDIRIIAENHLSLNQKLDDVKDLSREVLALQHDTAVLKSITKDNLFNIEALKIAK